MNTGCLLSTGTSGRSLPEFFRKIISLTFPASFTIEASVIIPITFIVIAWLILAAFTLHNNVSSFTDSIYTVIKNAPSYQADTGRSGSSSDDININTDNLDGRRVLLKYRLLHDGLKTISGGLEDED